MTPFSYARAKAPCDAVERALTGGGRYLGGGTNLVDLMRETIERPDALIDVTHLSDTIEEQPDGSLLIGSAVSNTALASHRLVRRRYPLVTRAIVSGASPQIRNMATLAGNLLQRTRCAYFYDVEGSQCNKRQPGQGCDAREGFNRMHAILGASTSCIAVHPSDLCVALAALDPVVHTLGRNGARALSFAEVHRLPEERPDIETMLEPEELITAIVLPSLSSAMRSTYRKVRDRSSYAFALISVAAALELEGDRIIDVRLGLGGVAPKPWRASRAEAVLRGSRAHAASFAAAAEAELAEAVPLRDNAFKIELARRTICAVLAELAGEAQ